MNRSIDHLDTDSTVITAAPIGITITDYDGYFVMVNPAYCKIYGYSEEELIGNHFTMVVAEGYQKDAAERHRHFMACDDPLQPEYESVATRKDGQIINLLINAARVKGPKGQVHKISYIIDITEGKQLFQRLEYLAQYDELTGLLNRRAGFKMIDEEVSRSHRHGSPLSIAICDLDDFKKVNDIYGHTAGDNVLREVADRMKDALRQYDKVVRKGGEEFLIILPNTVLEDAVSTLERLRAVVSATPMPEPKITQTLSAGVAQLKADESATALLDRADRILYQAKDDGRNRVESVNEAQMLTSPAEQ